GVFVRDRQCQRQVDIAGGGFRKTLDDGRKIRTRIGENIIDAEGLESREDGRSGRNLRIARQSHRHVRSPHPLSRCGSQSVMAGNASRRTTRMISAPKNGITPLKVSIIGVSLAMAEITKTFIPTG